MQFASRRAQLDRCCPSPKYGQEREVVGDLDGVVDLAEGGDIIAAVNKDVLASHEVRVALDAGIAVEPWEHGL